MSSDEATDKKTTDFYLQLLTRGNARQVQIGAPEDDPIAGAIQLVTDRILQHIGSSIRDADLALLLQPARVVVRAIPPAGVHALTVWVNPRHVVAVNRGLALFLYRLARAFSAHVIVRGPQDPPAPPESEAVGIIASLLDWMSSPVRAPLVEDWPVGPREVQTAENFTQAAERFVVADEIGHILHGHVIADSARVDTGRASIIDLDTRPLAQEIVADSTGVLLSIESTINDGIDPRAAVVGIHFFFQALELGEKVGAVHVDGSHLPAAERLDLCRNAIDQRYGTHAAALRLWALQADELIRRLGAAALEERNRRWMVVAARMDELLRTTAWPRQHGPALLKDVLSLMSQSPSAVLDALASSLLDAPSYEQLVATAPAKKALETNDRWRRHQIAHFIVRNSPPQVMHAMGITTVLAP